MKALVITVMVILFLFAIEFLGCALLSLVTEKPDDEACEPQESDGNN